MTTPTKRFALLQTVVLGVIAATGMGCAATGGSGDAPPTASIATTPSSNVQVGSLVVVDASGSSDPQGYTLDYTWMLFKPGSSLAALSRTEGVFATFCPDTEGNYVVRLEVVSVSASAVSDTETVTITATTSHSGGGGAGGGSVDNPAVIRSAIDGRFTGWHGETIFKPRSGQYWIQASYGHLYDYAYGPDVTLVLLSGDRYDMFVEGVGETIEVTQIRPGDYIESQIDGDFTGWEGDTVFVLTNGQVWQQTSYDYTYHYAYRPDVFICKVGSRFKMRVEGVDSSIYVERIS